MVAPFSVPAFFDLPHCYASYPTPFATLYLRKKIGRIGKAGESHTTMIHHSMYQLSELPELQDSALAQDVRIDVYQHVGSC